MPGSYEWGLFLHLVSVVGLVSSTAVLVFAISMMRRERTVAGLRPWARGASVADAISGVAAVGLALTGIWLVEDVDFDWGSGWINVSLIALILVSIAAVTFVTRKLRAISRAIDETPDGAIPQVLAAQITDPVLFAVAHTIATVTLGIIWNMTTKPGDAQAGIVIVIAALVGVASAIPMAQRQQSILEGKQ